MSCECETEVPDTRNWVESTDGKGHTTYTYYLRGYIDQAQAGIIIDLMNMWDATDNTSDWVFVITSHGGELPHGTAIFSVLRSYSRRGGGLHDVTTRVAGVAASAAALIFEAGDHRYGGDMDMLMIHEPLNTFEDMTAHDIIIGLYQTDRWTDQLVEILSERSVLSKTALRERFTGQDWWITMPDAVKLGIADEIV